MDISVHEKNTNVSQSVKEIAVEKLDKITRFVHDAHHVEVDFREQPSKNPSQRFICEVTVHCKKNFLKAHAEGMDAATALDLVIDKVEHQAQKLKSRRVSRFHPRKRDMKTHAMIPDEDLAALIFEDESKDEEAKVVKVKELDIKPMALEEAALQMDLLGHDFFVFQNIDDEKFSVMYRRKDGHLGMISPSS
ncbi:MAG: ribosome-associated translation inhibitor RaiA [Acidimicrobiia bacterium]